MGYDKSPTGTPYAQSPGATPYDPVPGDVPYDQIPGSTPYAPVPRLSAAPVAALDGLSSAPRAAYSTWRRLLTSYTGALYRVRKTTGGDTVTEHDVPYVAATNLADAADLATFVGSESWSVVTIYDQSNGRNLTQATTANQPRAGVAGVADTLSSHPAMVFDGSDDRLGRADALGLSGAVAISVWVDAQVSSAATEHVIANIGTNGANAYVALAYPTTTQLKIGINGGNRIFTASNLTTAGRKRIIARIGAGAQVGTSKVMQDGSELSEASSTNPTNTVTLGTAATTYGSDIIPSAGAFHSGSGQDLVFWAVDLSAGDLAIINAAA